MNVFSYILLAFPVYLAINDKLVQYVQLATKASAP